MYDSLKKPLGPTVTKVAPLKSQDGKVKITYKNKKMSLWVKHYLELYSHHTDISEETLDQLPALSVLSMP